jgi:general secretion pathway protein I
MGRKGFTLLEVMIALAVAGGLLVTLLYTLNHHLDVGSRHETLTVSMTLAKDKLSELRKGGREGHGPFPEPYSGYSYRAEVGESAYPGVSEISVAVSKDRERVVLRDLVRNEVFKK